MMMLQKRRVIRLDCVVRCIMHLNAYPAKKANLPALLLYNSFMPYHMAISGWEWGMGKESLLCGVNGAWEFQALRLWGVNKCFREMFEQEHQYIGTSFSVPWRDRHHYEKWKLILTTGRRIVCSPRWLWCCIFVLVIYCCVMNHPQTKWLKTKIMLLFLMFSLGQKFGKGSAGWFWIEVCPAIPVRQWLCQTRGSEGKEKLEAGKASLLLHMDPLNTLVWASSQHGGLSVGEFLMWQLRALA